MRQIIVLGRVSTWRMTADRNGATLWYDHRSDELLGRTYAAFVEPYDGEFHVHVCARFKDGGFTDHPDTPCAQTRSLSEAFDLAELELAKRGFVDPLDLVFRQHDDN